MTTYLTPLDISALRGLGIPEPWVFGQADRVRFYEIDALGHVNNTAYLRWFETVRVGWFSEYGFSDYGPDDPTFVLRAITCDYFAPMFPGLRLMCLWSLRCSFSNKPPSW